MKALALALAMVLLAAQTVLAACAGCGLPVFTENWENYGTPSYTSGTTSTIGPWAAHPCGNIGCGKISVVCTTGLPWKASGTGCYAHEEPGSVTVPNIGTGLYLGIGNPHKALLWTIYFKAESGFVGLNSFFLRINTNDTVPFGTDFITAAFGATGVITTYGGNSGANTLADTNWHVFNLCQDPGTGSNGTSYLAVDGTNWISATGVSSSAGQFATNNITFDDEYSSTNFDFGPMTVYDPGSCASATNLNFTYAYNFLPTSNGAVAWTPSTGSNYSNVNSSPPGANYNYDATTGDQDVYNLSVGALGTIVSQAVITNVQTDGPGDRVTVPLSTVGGATTAGTITNGVANSSGYQTLFSPISGASAPTAVGVQVQD